MLVEFVTCLDTAARQGKISIKFLLSPITIIIDILNRIEKKFNILVEGIKLQCKIVKYYIFEDLCL